MKRKLSIALITILGLIGPSFAGDRTQYEVIVNPLNTMPAVSQAVLRQVFLKQRVLNNLQPIDNQSSDVYGNFYQALLGWSLEDLANYWNRLRFSGSNLAPNSLATSQAVINYVASHQQAISYIPIQDDNNRVRALQVVS